MKKNMVLMLIAAAGLAVFAGCAGGAAGSPSGVETAESAEQSSAEMDTEAADAGYAEDAEGAEAPADTQEGSGAASFAWLPAGVEQQKAETEPNEELQQLIAEYYEIPDYELADTRYYYNYVDLDSDGENEIFAVVVGSYTSGTGGSSALWCTGQDGALTVKQAFTLVNMPVIVADNEEGGPKDLILERSGGGAETEYVKLTCTDGEYTNVSDAETVTDLESVQGVAILCNDLADDMQTGNYLTLE